MHGQCLIQENYPYFMEVASGRWLSEPAKGEKYKFSGLTVIVCTLRSIIKRRTEVNSEFQCEIEKQLRMVLLNSKIDQV